MNNKFVAVALLALMFLAAASTPSGLVFGQNTNLGVNIYQVTPSSLTGPVGSSVNVQGTIYQSNGTYQIIFGQYVVASGTSDGYYVNTNFTVPEVPMGSYGLTLRDTSININSTQTFQVTLGYFITPVSTLIQEGNSIKITVSVEGGQLGTMYGASVSVMLPSPVSTDYSKIVSLGLPNGKGTASAQVTFPDSSFQPSGSSTAYVGTYNVNYNETQGLATNQFSVGFLDAVSYHRGQTVNINAAGYQPNQGATVTIVNAATDVTLDSVSVIASADGLITASWVVPSNAAIGSYTVKIASQGTQKTIPDQQNFSVSGYPIKIKTLNLAGEVATNIQVTALDQSSNTNAHGVTGTDGIATITLESGPQLLTALWNGVNVGSNTITVSGATDTYTLQCQLTDIKINVQNNNGASVPFVNLAIKYQYQPATGGVQTGNASGLTDPTGSFTLGSILPGITYTIDASLYGTVFNTGNDAYQIPTGQPVSEVTITCPTENLTLTVVGSNQAEIIGARVELVELSSGLFYSGTTDSLGSTTNQVTFGMYRARIYKGNILINETTIQAFSDVQKQILCSYYGIQVKVSVVDFFGNPLSNANVTLNGQESIQYSAVTKSNGVATFTDIIGGDMQIVAFMPSAPNDYQAQTLTINGPASVQIKIDRYVALGSLMLQVSSFITILVIVIAIVLLLMVELIRRRKHKQTVET